MISESMPFGLLQGCRWVVAKDHTIGDRHDFAVLKRRGML
jgi:hypothetical protein